MHSEKDLLPPGVSLGNWEFSLTDDEINAKLELLPNIEGNLGEDFVRWKTLFSILTPKEDIKTYSNSSKRDQDVCVVKSEPMECSSDDEVVEERQSKESFSSTSDIEDITIAVVDSCNQVAHKLEPDFCWDLKVKDSLVRDLKNLNASVLSKVLEKSWCQLNSDASKLCFCVTFSITSAWCEVLCRQILVPWMSKSLPSKLELYSGVFSKQGELFCKNLLAPLLQFEDSLLVKDLLSLEDIMTSMSKENWTVLLKDLLTGLSELYSWNIPVLAVVVEHSDPSFDELCVLVRLMSSAGSTFAKNRDFGALLVAVAVCIKPGFASVIPQIKLIANTYKGPLKFKVLKVLGDIKE